MATRSNLSLIDAASPIIEQITLFHDHTILILTIVLSVVGYALYNVTYNTLTNTTLTEGQTIETVWTIIPTIALTLIALPSLKILYLTEEPNPFNLTLNVIGHQWYWSYELSDFNNVEFDSYIDNSDFRLLGVDNSLTLPNNTETRVVVSSTDVVHAWAIPSISINADAVPGRLNQLFFSSNYSGVFYGQCSEICGANHSFIPINIDIVPPKSFSNWLNEI